MDAKGIWNTANSRIINSSTHKVMEKPKLSDFKGPNRKVRNKKYQDALRKYRDFLAKQKKQKLNETTKVTSRGRRPLSQAEIRKRNANKKPEGPYAKDRVGTIDTESKAYKEAKRINESIPITSTKKKEEKPKVEKKEEKKVVEKKEEPKKVTEEKKVVEKKEEPKKKTNREKFNERFIRKKGGRLARRGTPAAMRAEARERARKKVQAAAKLRIKKKKEAQKKS